METGVESVVGSTAQAVGVVSGAGGQLDWLNGSFLQSALCQVFQRFALEGDEENKVLVHKVYTPNITELYMQSILKWSTVTNSTKMVIPH